MYVICIPSIIPDKTNTLSCNIGILSFVGFLLVVSAQPPQPSVGCHSNGVCYEVHPGPVTWQQAYDDCWDSGHILSVIQNITIRDWITTEIELVEECERAHT